LSDKIIYGVQLHPCGQICYFTPGSWPELNKGDHVVVRIDRGEALAEIVRILSPRKETEQLESAAASSATQAQGNAAQTESGLPKTDNNDEPAEDENEHPAENRTANKPEKKQAFAGEPFQWEVWDGDEQEEEVSSVEAGVCLDPNSPNLQPILRPASEADLIKADDNQGLAKKAHCFCVQRSRHHNLDMKMVQTDYMLDGSKIIFYFTAPNRIDFRELVKDLVKEFRTRIELRQIGVRHETQMVGATGNCGMVCCCRRYMRRFAPVTIKMAKEQNLFLNPAKISGTCGRLLCCLAFEQEGYEEFHSRCPKMGKKYTTNKGVVKVLRSSIFRNTLSLLPEEGDEYDVSLEEWQSMDPARQGQVQQQRKHPSRPAEDFESEEQQSGRESGGQHGQRQDRSRDRKRPDRPRRDEPETRNGKDAQEEKSGRDNREGRDGRERRDRREGHDQRDEHRESKHEPGSAGSDQARPNPDAPAPQQQPSRSEQLPETTNASPGKGNEIKTAGLARFLATTNDEE